MTDKKLTFSCVTSFFPAFMQIFTIIDLREWEYNSWNGQVGEMTGVDGMPIFNVCCFKSANYNDVMFFRLRARSLHKWPESGTFAFSLLWASYFYCVIRYQTKKMTVKFAFYWYFWCVCKIWHVAWGSILGLQSWYPLILVKLPQLTWRADSWS